MSELKKIKLIKGLVYLKLVILLVSIFAYFSHPHIIRQMDTLGITLRYWLRWTAEPTLQYPLFPALIQAGDSYGIHATEFPLLYILMAPLFSLPMPWAIFANRFVFLFLNLCLTFISYKVWIKNKDLDFDFKLAHMVMLIFGLSSVYIGRYMPDYTAFILVNIAMGLSWKKINYKSLFIAALGLLIKPTAIIAFAFYLLKNKKDLLLQIFKWIIPATAIALIYYTVGIRYLNELSDIPKYFYSSFRNPIGQLIDFFLVYKQIPKLLFRNIFSAYVLVILLWDMIKNKPNTMRLWSILGLQILTGAALDGDHSFIHDYYYIGGAFVVALIVAEFIKRLGTKVFYLFFIILFFHTLEKGLYATRSTFTNHLFWQCSEFSNYLAGEFKIRNIYSRPADLGTCVGKVQNSKNANFGISYKTDGETSGKLVKETDDLELRIFE